MARNSIAANLLMVVLLAGGFWTAQRIQKEVEPQFQLDVVEVSRDLPGRGTRRGRDGHPAAVEESCAACRGIKEITSTAREGSGSSRSSSSRGRPHDSPSRTSTRPSAASAPSPTTSRSRRSACNRAARGHGDRLHGEVDIWTLRKLAERLRDQLLERPGTITQVELGASPTTSPTSRSRRPAARARAHARAGRRLIAESSQDVPAGDVQTHSRRDPAAR